MMLANLFFALREMGVTVAVLFMIVLRLPAYACILLRMPASRRDRRATCATVCGSRRDLHSVNKSAATSSP
jgi:hypothetical protein